MKYEKATKKKPAETGKRCHYHSSREYKIWKYTTRLYVGISSFPAVGHSYQYRTTPAWGHFKAPAMLTEYTAPLNRTHRRTASSFPSASLVAQCAGTRTGLSHPSAMDLGREWILSPSCSQACILPSKSYHAQRFVCLFPTIRSYNSSPLCGLKLPVIVPILRPKKAVVISRVKIIEMCLIRE
jgi:hypothetical protein